MGGRVGLHRRWEWDPKQGWAAMPIGKAKAHALKRLRGPMDIKFPSKMAAPDGIKKRNSP